MKYVPLQLSIFQNMFSSKEMCRNILKYGLCHTQKFQSYTLQKPSPYDFNCSLSVTNCSNQTWLKTIQTISNDVYACVCHNLYFVQLTIFID